MHDPEDEVQRAIARGDFADLPGAGRPLDLPSTHDPDWWIRQRLEDDDIDRDALLPAVMLLRREHEHLEEEIGELPTEEMVRFHLEDYNRRVLADRRDHPLARMLAPTVDVEERVQSWRAQRAKLPPASETASAKKADGAAPRRRRWWQRRPTG